VTQYWLLLLFCSFPVFYFLKNKIFFLIFNKLYINIMLHWIRDQFASGLTEQLELSLSWNL
jgi:hypothetical protein